MGTPKILFGKRIKDLRIRAGYAKQADLANALDTDRTRISRWESGKNEPKGDYRTTLIRLLKTTEDALFGIGAPSNPDLSDYELGLELVSKLKDGPPDIRYLVMALVEGRPQLMKKLTPAFVARLRQLLATVEKL